jgi:hypothetical protein
LFDEATIRIVRRRLGAGRAAFRDPGHAPKLPPPISNQAVGNITFPKQTTAKIKTGWNGASTWVLARQLSIRNERGRQHA